MSPKDLRVVSLIPSTTEILAALGLGDILVGRSHECDYPPMVTDLPVCTAANLDSQDTSRQIHDRVTDLLQSALSIYRVDLELLEQLQPTHILTQAQCEVCAVSLADVETAVGQLVQSSPQIISLQPSVLAEVWHSMQQVALALGVDSAPIINQLQARIDTCHQQAHQEHHRPRVACIEWTDPLMAAGNWVPELVDLAGGDNLFGTKGKHSPWLPWEQLQAADPEMLVFMPCGFDLAQTGEAVQELSQKPQWRSLRAVQSNQVLITDGNQYFNRPGPRLVDSLEILAEILHPQSCQFGYEGMGWQRLTLQ